MPDRVQNLRNHLSFLTVMSCHFRREGMLLRARLFEFARDRCEQELSRAEAEELNHAETWEMSRAEH